MNKSILVVDVINVFSLIAIVFRKNPIKRIYFLQKEHGILFSVFYKIFEKLGYIFQDISYKFDLNSESRTFYAELEELTITEMEKIKNRIFFEKIMKASGISEVERQRMAVALSKYALIDIYLPLKIYVIMKHEKIIDNNVSIFVFRRSRYHLQISQLFRDINLNIQFYYSLGNNRFNGLESLGMLRSIQAITRRKKSLSITAGVVFYSIFRKIIYLISIGCKKNNLKPHKICALVVNTYATDKCNCIPWVEIQDNKIRSEILSIGRTSMNYRVKKYYSERSDCFIECKRIFYTKTREKEIEAAWLFYLSYFLKNIWLYRNIFNLYWVSSGYLFYALIYLSFYESLFKANGTKLLWVMNEDDSEGQYAAMAINRLNGVSLGATWSMIPLPICKIQKNQNDIYFIWGKRLSEIGKEIDDQCKYFIISGYPGDKLFRTEFNRSIRFRERIFRKYGNVRILTYYDVIGSKDSFITPKDISNMYEVIFSWLEDDDKNFLIIKAKRKEAIQCHFKENEEIKEGVKFYREKGRLLIIFEKAAMYPGFASDVVIGMTLTLSSLSALARRPFVFYDIHDTNNKYPLRIPGVFATSNREELKRMIVLAVEKGSTEPNNVFDPVKDTYVDPFVDGMAGNRISKYIKDILLKLDIGCSNIEAIEYANYMYERIWGKDKVVAGPLYNNV